MINQITQFKAIVQGIESIFHFDCNCPTSVAKEAVLECLKWIGQIEDAAKANLVEEVKVEEVKAEEPPEEVKNDQSPV